MVEDEVGEAADVVGGGGGAHQGDWGGESDTGGEGEVGGAGGVNGVSGGWFGTWKSGGRDLRTLCRFRGLAFLGFSNWVILECPSFF